MCRYCFSFIFYISSVIIFLSSVTTVHYFIPQRDIGRRQRETEAMLSVVVTVILAVLSSSEAGIVLDVDTDVGQSSSVKLSVFYESLCGDSIRFITHQLFPTWQHFADDQTLQLDLVPFGKATVRLYRS